MLMNRSYLEREFRALSDDDLRVHVPSVFAARAWEQMSDRYAFMPTIAVVQRLRGEGFMPIRAAQSRTRIEGKRDFVRHMVTFRRHDSLRQRVDQLMPEINLVNAHDGSAAFSLFAGLFRLVCLNGLMVSDGTIASIHARHTGGEEAAGRVIEGSYRIIDEAPEMLESVEKFRGIKLTGPQVAAFANAATLLRWGDLEQAPVQPAQLLTVHRQEDKDANLWNTLNVIQENMMKGGLRVQQKSEEAPATRARRTTTRSVKAVAETVRLNRGLWMLAEQMAQTIG